MPTSAAAASYLVELNDNNNRKSVGFRPFSSPSLYKTPQTTTIPQVASSFSSPYVINHKRRLPIVSSKQENGKRMEENGKRMEENDVLNGDYDECYGKSKSDNSLLFRENKELGHDTIENGKSGSSYFAQKEDGCPQNLIFESRNGVSDGNGILINGRNDDLDVDISGNGKDGSSYFAKEEGGCSQNRILNDGSEDLQFELNEEKDVREKDGEDDCKGEEPFNNGGDPICRNGSYVKRINITNGGGVSFGFDGEIQQKNSGFGEDGGAVNLGGDDSFLCSPGDADYTPRTNRSEFFDADEDLLLEDTIGSSDKGNARLQAEIDSLKAKISMEIERRAKAEEYINYWQKYWRDMSAKLSEIGLTLPPLNSFSTTEEVQKALSEFVYQLDGQLAVARTVADTFGRVVVREELHSEMKNLIENKDFEISRLRDKIQYHELVSREMSQRNQETIERGRRRRQKKLVMGKWIWLSLTFSAVIGGGVLAYKFIPWDLMLRRESDMGGTAIEAVDTSESQSQ